MDDIEKIIKALELSVSAEVPCELTPHVCGVLLEYISRLKSDVVKMYDEYVKLIRSNNGKTE